MKNYIYLLVCCLAFFNACQTNSTKNDNQLLTTIKQDSTYKWLDNERHYEDKTAFKNRFDAAYTKAIADKNYVLAGEYLNAYGSTICTLNDNDSLYLIKAEQFVTQNYLPAKNLTIARLQFIIAEMYLLKGDLKTIKQKASENILYCNFEGAEKELGQSRNLLAIYYGSINDNEQCIKELVANKKLYEKLNDTANLGETNYNLSVLYNLLFDFPNAELNLNDAIKSFKEARDTGKLISACCEKVIRKSATNTANPALVDSIRLWYKQFSKSNAYTKYEVHNMLLNYYLHGKQYDSAAYYIAKCKKYNSLNNNIEDQQFIKELEVELLIAQNKPCPDISLLKAAALEFDTTHNYYRARETYMLLMQNAKTQHNVNEALYYLEKHNAVNDSVIKIETRNNWLELDKKYQTEKKEHQLQSQNSKLEKNKIQIAGLLALLLALGLGTILFFVYKKRKQSKKDYENQVQFTASLFEKTEEERKRIATDLHDSVSHELLSLKTENQTEFATINTKIDSIIDEIRSISRNLHPVLFESLGLQISLENMFERLQSQHQIIISHEINYAKNLNTNDELQVYRIIQEGISNIIKYANAHAAKISISSTSSQINIEIKDSGKGFNVAEKLASGKAFGLHNILQRAKTLGGEASIESNQNGTTISIKIPVK